MNTHSRLSHPPRGYKFLAILICVFSLLTLWTTAIYAQGGSGATPLALSPGVPAGSYAMSDVDAVNLFNGRVNVYLPLLNMAGRGGAGAPISITMNYPANWHVNQYYDDNGGVHYAAEENQTSSGFHFGDYQLRVVGSGDGAQNPCYPGTPNIWQTTLTRISFIEPDGTEHEMRDFINGGRPFTGQSQCYGDGPSRGRVFVSMDGSGATYIADAAIKDGMHVGDENPTGGGAGGWLLLKNGRRFRITSAETRLRDRNGNTMTWGATVQDSLNRRVTPYQDFSSQCGFLGAGAADYCTSIAYKGFGGAGRLIWVSYDGATRPHLIVLPNNLRYRFYYNQYGDLIRLDLPTGGSIEYDYGAGLDGTQTDYSQLVDSPIPGVYPGGPPNVNFHIYRRVTERRAYRENHVLESRQTFSKPESTQAGNLGYVERRQYDANNNLMGSEKHFFHGSANSSFSLGVMSFAPWKDGREYRTEVYDRYGALLRQTEQTWAQRAPVSWWTGDPEAAPANDPRVVETITRLENGLTTQTSYGYDPTVSYNSLMDVSEFGYGNGVPGPLLRRTHTDYVKMLNGVDYTGSNLYTDQNPQATSTPYLRELPQQVSVYDGWGPEWARTNYEYDNYTPDAGNKHAALINYSDISGLCTWSNSSNQCVNFNPATASDPTSYQTRGNVTAVTRSLLYTTGAPASDPITSYMQYDIAGNVVKTIDPRGNATSVDFSDRFGVPNDDEARANSQPTEWLTSGQSHAFATKAVNAPGFTSYSQFDYYTGKSVNVEDINGTVTSASYDDVLDRQTQVISAANIPSLRHRSTAQYNDTLRIVKSYSDQNGDNDHAFHQEVYYDGLGRPTQRRIYDSATLPDQYILVTTEYDALGRVIQVSNPYTPSLGESPIYTVTEYDDLSRVKKVTAPDSQPVVTDYAANTVTMTDQAGKKRTSTTDALGRLMQIIEDPDYYHFITNYTYDVLGNLRKVAQGAQARYFAYDSLSRLIRTKNPEQDVNSSLPSVIDPITGCNQWSTAYTYDANSNPQTMIDPRGVVTTNTYDQLNRLKTVIYTNDPTNTAPVTLTYDASGATNSKGRLTSVSSSVSTYNYTAYDAAGRVTGSSQVTDGQTYAMSYGYDRAGELTSQTYHSGRVVNTSYDVAGRIIGLNGQKNNQTTPYLSAIKYWSFGAMKEMQLGNGLNAHTLFNNRLQPTLVALGTSNTDSSVMKLEYGYGVLGGNNALDVTRNNGNIQSQKITVPGLASPLIQTYSYDELNRLHDAQENGGASWKQTFVYDQYGNRSIDAANTTSDLAGENPQFNAPTTNNRITPRPNEHYRYDAAGNLDRDKADAPFSYDATNRIVAFNGGTTIGTIGTSYYFDGLGQRIKKATSDTATVCVYDAFGKLVAEYTSTPSGTGGTHFLTTDPLDTPRLLTDAQGAVTSRHDYLPFGEEIGGTQVALKGGRSAAQRYVSDNLRQQFTGKERDAESGLDYMLARDYQSGHGRFTSVDPLLASAQAGNPQTFNRYTYGWNNPLRLNDPLGMDPQEGDSNDPFQTQEEKRKAQQEQQLPPATTKIDLTNLQLPPFEPVGSIVPSGTSSFSAIGLGLPPVLPIGNSAPASLEIESGSEREVGDGVFSIGNARDYQVRDQYGKPFTGDNLSDDFSVTEQSFEIPGSTPKVQTKLQTAGLNARGEFSDTIDLANRGGVEPLPNNINRAVLQLLTINDLSANKSYDVRINCITYLREGERTRAQISVRDVSSNPETCVLPRR